MARSRPKAIWIDESRLRVVCPLCATHHIFHRCDTDKMRLESKLDPDDIFQILTVDGTDNELLHPWFVCSGQNCNYEGTVHLPFELFTGD
jgi:hypothetical protein